MDKIPQMKIEDGKIVEETMSLDIIVNGKPEKIILKKLSSGERSKITSSCTKTKYLAGQPQIDVNNAEIESALLSAAIVSAPFPSDIAGIKALPSDVTDYIMAAWVEFTSPTNAKKD